MSVSTRTRHVIEEVDLRTADDKVLAEVVGLHNAMLRERHPEDPPTSVEAFAARVHGRPNMVRMREWIARSATGELVARASVARFEADTNKHFREANIEVAPAHRRQGIAKQLLKRIVAGAEGGDDVVIEFYTNDRVPSGAAFLERIGAKRTLEMHVNELALERVDRAMTREWAAIDPPGYRLEWISEDVPESLIANLIVAYDAMNAAPRGTSTMEDWNTTPEMIREFDRSRRAAGLERTVLLAIEASTGETAGYSELAYDPKTQHVIQQRGTAVIPAHRGKGIGKWIKASLLERAIRDWPAARVVRTGNADVNAPMLAINSRLGFRPAFATEIWEIGIADARRYAEGATD